MKHPFFAAGALALGLLTVSLPAMAAGKFECGGPESATIAEVVKPLIEKAKLCKGLKQKVDAGLFKVKIKIDQTRSVKVEKINYCTSPAHRKIEATVADHDAEGRATLQSEGIITIPARKEIMDGIQAVQRRLRKRPDGTVGLYVYEDSLIERDDWRNRAR